MIMQSSHVGAFSGERRRDVGHQICHCSKEEVTVACPFSSGNSHKKGKDMAIWWVLVDLHSYTLNMNSGMDCGWSSSLIHTTTRVERQFKR
jgi:hypothetical protein